MFSPGAFTSTSSLADDGVTDTGVTLEMITGGSESTAPVSASAGIARFLVPPLTTGNSQIFAFVNVPDGVYNLVLFGDNGTFHGSSNATTFTVDGIERSLTNNFTDNALIPNVTYVVFTNLAVSGGNLTGTWQGIAVVPGVEAEGDMNGAQLQRVGPLPPTIICPDPVTLAASPGLCSATHAALGSPG